MAPGLLHVTMDPAESLSEHEFHDWYNNEHGPTRLRLPFCTTGTRYTRYQTPESSPSPPWLAIYDFPDMAKLESQEYLCLRSPPSKSQREIDVMKQIVIDRNLLDLVGEHVLDSGAVGGAEALAEITIQSQQNKNSIDVEAEARALQKKVESTFAWTRVTSYRSQSKIVLLCRLKAELLDGAEFKHAIQVLLSVEQGETFPGSTSLRLWKLHYTFGPAPRHLSADGNRWAHNGTRTIPGSKSPSGLPFVESYTVLEDGLSIPYCLEGSSDPEAPVICLVNSVMVHWDIWDEFVTAFMSQKQNSKYRILRFAPRGRYAPDRLIKSPKVTVDLLAHDIIGLLKALTITQVDCIVGVSLGGATALRAGLLFPDIFKSFIACDTNASAPSGNAAAWAARIDVAEAENAVVFSSTGPETIIGDNLADATVQRWAAPGSLDDPTRGRRFRRVREGVKISSLEGFKRQVQALYEYDFWDDMKTAKTKGVFVVGKEDGKLPEGMKKMADGYGTGTLLHVVDDAGHLPMVEKPEEVAKILSDFLIS